MRCGRKIMLTNAMQMLISYIKLQYLMPFCMAFLFRNTVISNNNKWTCIILVCLWHYKANLPKVHKHRYEPCLNLLNICSRVSIYFFWRWLMIYAFVVSTFWVLQTLVNIFSINKDCWCDIIIQHVTTYMLPRNH